MKLNFVLSKAYNHFHFVENFSEWSVYTRSDVNSGWIIQTGPLNKGEQKSLVEAQKFFIKYNYGQSVGKYKNIFEFFATVKNLDTPNKELLELVGPENHDRILNALEAFKPRFEKIWQEQIEKFEEKRKIITDNLNEKEILEDIGTLFGEVPVTSNLDIYLVITNSQYASGGANIGKGRITLECSSAVAKNDIMSIFWHELTHLILKDYTESVHELLNKNKIGYGYVNEIIAHSIFGTFGLLSHKYYKAKYMLDATQKLEQAISGEIKVSEESKEKFKLNSGQYYMAKFIEENFVNNNSVSPQEMAKFIDKSYTKIYS